MRPPAMRRGSGGRMISAPTEKTVVCGGPARRCKGIPDYRTPAMRRGSGGRMISAPTEKTVACGGLARRYEMDSKSRRAEVVAPYKKGGD